MTRYNPEGVEQYRKLFSDMTDCSNINFHFLIAGIGVPNLDDQLDIREYEYTDRRAQLLHALVAASLRRIRESIHEEFAPRPNENLCKSCALKDVCPTHK
jgi:hypothetical protein